MTYRPFEFHDVLETRLRPVPVFSRWLPTPLDVSCDGGVYLGRDLFTIDGARLRRFNMATRVALALVTAATLAGANLRGISFRYDGIEFFIFMSLALLIASSIAQHKNRNPPLAATAALLGECVLTPIVTGPFTYIALTYSGPDQTALAVQIDHWLRFDWVTYNNNVKDSHYIDVLFKLAYVSFDVQYLALPVLLFACGYAGHARLLLNCFIWGVIIVMSVAMIFPTIDPLLWHQAIRVDESGYTGLTRIDHLLRLRDGSMTEIPVKQLDGIICFPSFHAVGGCLFVGFFCHIAQARHAMIALNALMLAATPRWGGHYLVDVLAGIAIGVGLIAAAQAYVRRRPEAGAIASLP